MTPYLNIKQLRIKKIILELNITPSRTFEKYENVDICLCIIAQYRQLHILEFKQAILKSSLNIGVSIDVISIL